MNYTQLINHWLETRRLAWDVTVSSCSLFIPNRSVGRPYDDARHVTNITETQDTLTVMFDNKLTLTFYGLKKLEEKEDESSKFLVFSSFERFEFSYASKNEVFTEGEVKFADHKSYQERGIEKNLVKNPPSSLGGFLTRFLRKLSGI